MLSGLDYANLPGQGTIKLINESHSIKSSFENESYNYQHTISMNRITKKTLRECQKLASHLQNAPENVDEVEAKSAPHKPQPAMLLNESSECVRSANKRGAPGWRRWGHNGRIEEAVIRQMLEEADCKAALTH